jgi:cellulose biosynthesis protein BcsQ
VPLRRTLMAAGRRRAQAAALVGAFDDILIDARGLDSEALRIAVSRSDLPVMPVQPCAVDVWALVDMAGLISRPNQRRGERGEDIAGDDDRDRLRRLPRSPSA